ncbi:MAG: host-nuclease inhibitor Gam family protein [Promethearchaeota archaeon]|jgi:phage host-nuclease inhibitor protein Gam
MGDLRTILTEGLSADQTLTSMYEIEDILLLIGEVNRKVDYYKEMKKHRMSSIDEKISDLTGKTDCLRQIILNTMKKVAPKDKTLDFPDIGKVTRRQPRETLVVDDQDQVLDYLEKSGTKDQVVKVVESIDKRKLNSLVQQYTKAGEKVPGVSTVKSTESLSITFEKPKPQSETEAAALEVDLDALDSLMV